MFKAYFLNFAEWGWWAWPGAAVIVGGTLFNVNIDVWINAWHRQFWSLIQKALQHKKGEVVDSAEIYGMLFSFGKIAGIAIVVQVLLDFFTSHWTFRWRRALTDNYVRNWERLRKIEGASQRIQEDTMRFAKIVETLGAKFIEAVLRLFAFLPVLSKLSLRITHLPLIGPIDNALVFTAIFWSLLGTFLLAGVGIRLPGLEVQQQKLEAAFRKELVYGEDSAQHAGPDVCRTLFGDVRGNAFTIFLNYMYFNVARYSYLQFDAIFPLLLLTPTICNAKSMGMGYIQQATGAFGRVTESFQYLLTSWSTIVDLISIYKRLLAFEATLARDSDDSDTSDGSEGDI